MQARVARGADIYRGMILKAREDGTVGTHSTGFLPRSDSGLRPRGTPFGVLNQEVPNRAIGSVT